MRAVYLANAAEATRVQDLIDGDVFPLDVTSLSASCNRTATITVKRMNRQNVYARACDIGFISRCNIPVSAIETQ
jgi:hypothetical protein